MRNRTKCFTPDGHRREGVIKKRGQGIGGRKKRPLRQGYPPQKHVDSDCCFWRILTTDRPTDRPTSRLTNRPTDRPADRPIYRLTDLPTYRSTDRLTDRAAAAAAASSHLKDGPGVRRRQLSRGDVQAELYSHPARLGAVLVSNSRLVQLPDRVQDHGHEHRRRLAGRHPLRHLQRKTSRESPFTTSNIGQVR